MGIRGILETRRCIQHTHRKRRKANLARIHATSALHSSRPRFLRNTSRRNLSLTQNRKTHQTSIRIPCSWAGHHLHRLHLAWKHLFHGNDRCERRHGAHPPSHATHCAPKRTATLVRAELPAACRPIGYSTRSTTCLISCKSAEYLKT